VLSALVLVATGAGLALGQIGSLSDLLQTGYGATLAVKLGLVAVVLTLGALARRRAELAIAVAVLATASLLVSLAPP
jgi:putative copper export protein